MGMEKDNWDFLKQTGTPWELFANKEWDKLQKRTHRMLLGHNRWATAGKISDDNAHPFAHGDFVGVHNGTIRSQWRLKDNKDFEVDSENIYYNMSQEGIEETLKKLEGPFALVWYNADKGALQMVRNKERPLFICKSEDGMTYFWASEPWMLRIALAKHDIKHGDIAEVEDGKLLSIDIPYKGLSKDDKFIPSIRSVEFYKTPVYTPSEYSRGGYDGYSNYHSGPSMPLGRQGGVHNNVLPFVRPAVGENALKHYLGKTVVFSVLGERTVAKQDFILCEVEDSLQPDIRIFSTGKTKLGKMLMGSNKFFKGKVKSCTAKAAFGNYLTMDHRTIIELNSVEVDKILEDQVKDAVKLIEHKPDEPEEEKEIFVMGFRGQHITLEEWYRDTDAGCSWCSDFAKVDEANSLLWLKKNEYICHVCQLEPEVMAMINQIK